MAKLKYQGSADIRRISKGETFGGQLQDDAVVQSDLVFDKDNFWVVDTEEAGLSQEAVDLLIQSGDFKDVTEAKRVPPNRHQTTFLGLKSVTEAETVMVTTAATATGESVETTTTGGSTDSATGAGTGGAPGGSTRTKKG